MPRNALIRRARRQILKTRTDSRLSARLMKARTLWFTSLSKPSSAGSSLIDNSRQYADVDDHASFARCGVGGTRSRIMSTPIPIGPTLSQIGQIFVNVKQLERAISFYRDILGITFL